MNIKEHGSELISLYLDGEIDSKQLGELDQKLIENREFADRFARTILTHRQITELLAEDKVHALLDLAIANTPSIPMAMKSKVSGRSHEHNTRTWADFFSDDKKERGLFRLRPSWIGIAAALLAAVGMFAWQSLHPSQSNLVQQSGLSNSNTHSFKDPSKSRFAATVTRTSDCRWVAGSEPLLAGDQLEVGARVALESGFAKITFECGAEVVLQGPCEFLIENPMLSFLKSGRITASVPRRAFSFAIRSPGVDFVDLGTEFGIDVNAEGQSELHVFDGEVIYRQDSELLKSNEVIHVLQDKAVLLTSASDDATAIEMNKDLFSGHFGLSDYALSESSLPLQQDLTLWLSAEYGVDTDDEGYVLSWRDRTLGDNKFGEDAYQTVSSNRPQFIKDGTRKNPAIRFDGQDDFLLTTPIETTDNQTVFLVCQFSQEAFSDKRIYGGQILNYDGPPSREAAGKLVGGVLQIGEPLLQEEFQPSLVTAQVFAGFRGQTTIEAGRVDDAEPVGSDTPVVIAFCYDYDHRKSTLLINDRETTANNAFAPAGLTSRKVIGRHAWMELFYHGDLSELIIFNRALTPKELTSMTHYLADKYEIPVAIDANKTVEVEN